MNENTWVAKEAWLFLAVLLVLAIGFKFIFWPLAWLFALIALGVLFFFRNPRRSIPLDDKAALSPADGTIMGVAKVRENRFLNGGEVWKVTIFLSVFDVHFNRIPLDGTVEQVQYVEGQFFPAFKSHAGEDNERNYVLLNTKRGQVIIAQITGFVARRIVCYAQKGQSFKQGQRFGLIKFGSCTELYLPLCYQIEVKTGDKVKGGVTVIGRAEQPSHH